MINTRFDYRTIDKFKKDIYFGSAIEKYLFNKWIELCDTLSFIHPSNYKDNGVSNDGKFIKKGKTSGADYILDLKYDDFNLKNLPLEIKWVPTAGKFSLKEGDLKSYIKEKAAILFIYNVNKDNKLSRPKDYNDKEYIKKIENNLKNIRWGIMMPERVESLYKKYKDNDEIKRIYYMGGKPGLILKQEDYSLWFLEEFWL